MARRAGPGRRGRSGNNRVLYATTTQADSKQNEATNIDMFMNSILKNRVGVTLVVAVALVVVLSGCNEEADSASDVRASPGLEVTVPSRLRPEEFFPMKVDQKWAYRITIGEVEPIKYTEVRQPMGSGTVVSAHRSRFLPLLKNSRPRSFRLELRVKASAPRQGPLEYPEGVEIEVAKDDLGIFEGVERVFFAVTRSPRYEALLVTTFLPDSSSYSGSWGSWDAKPGQAMRLLFFGEKPYTQIGLGHDPKDALLFVGPEDGSPIHRLNGPVLHFKRTVQPAERERDNSEGDVLDQGFSEETYWGMGKGLIFLRQVIDGKTSMTWELVTDSEV